MTRLLFVLGSICMLLACKPGIPKDIEQPEELEKILYDIHVVDAYVSTIPQQDSAKKVSAPFYKGVFKKYGTDSAKHAKSMAYYYKNPDVLAKMYDRISERLTKEREAENKLQQKKALKPTKLEEVPVN